MEDKNVICLFWKKINSESGAVAVIIAIFLIVLLGLAALAVDVGYVRVARNESQNAADAAALAGARQLGENYYNSLTDRTTYVVNTAQNTAHQNKVAGLNLAEDMAAGNVVTSIGNWDWSAKTFTGLTPGLNPDAVQVVVDRAEGTTNGPISTFFAKIFKVINPSSSDTVNVGATACAALTGPCEGKPTIPVGIAKGWFESEHGKATICSDNIQMNDTNTSCAGWTNLTVGDKEANWKKDILPYMTESLSIPSVTAGNNYEFTGGQLPGLYTGLKTLFEDPTYDTANKKIVAGKVVEWNTAVIVYDANCGENPHGGMLMDGFATITITGVQDTPPMTIFGHLACGMATTDPGGCAAYGTYSYNQPRLVR